MKWKLNYLYNNDIKKILNFLLKKKINFFFNKKTYIINILKNKYIFIYNGLFYKKFLIRSFFTGYRIGNFIFTKKFFKYNKKLKKNKR